MTFRDDPSYYESCYRCGDDAIGMTGLCHSCHESAETSEECSPEDCIKEDMAQTPSLDQQFHI